MRQKLTAKKLKGVVEVDETYIGGKPRKDNGKDNKRGRGTKKTAVMALIERKGNAISKPVEGVNAKSLKSAIREMVDKSSTLMTDEWPAYSGIGREFAGGHNVINHGSGEYVNGDISTNTAESYFALLKRGVHGTFHHISKQHLHRYCDEFSFRWNHRKVSDGERATQAIKGIEGKRLLLKPQ
jgi:transposase-like protein